MEILANVKYAFDLVIWLNVKQSSFNGAFRAYSRTYTPNFSPRSPSTSLWQAATSLSHRTETRIRRRERFEWRKTWDEKRRKKRPEGKRDEKLRSKAQF